MIVEDSPTVRTLLCYIVERDPRLKLVAVCANAEEALDSIPSIRPDVVSMDIRLPGMDGLEATRRIMAEHPTPIVVIAGSVHDSQLGIALNALKAGALTVVEKPVDPSAAAYEEVADTIATQLAIMSEVPVIRQRGSAQRRVGIAPVVGTARPSMIALAASTGGPPALASLLGALPATFPVPLLVVQHMGGAFMAGFAEWLDGQTALDVRIAAEGERPVRGCVYVAPGDRHLTLSSAGLLRIGNEPPLGNQRPSATVLFRSLASVLGPKGMGVLLTGMGEDGARGLLEMRQAGGLTLAEDESSCVVYGMPAAAVRLGAACESVPLDAIAAKLIGAVAEAES
ncbi:MAG: chemotaxis-specific protein-glutamate methyltransferase CheB [Alphaproteobacteria bacterium]